MFIVLYYTSKNEKFQNIPKTLSGMKIVVDIRFEGGYSIMGVFYEK